MRYKRDYSQGKEDAQRDLARGELIFKTAGSQASWAGHWNRVLQNRYGVKLVWGVVGQPPDDAWHPIFRRLLRHILDSLHPDGQNDKSRPFERPLE